MVTQVWLKPHVRMHAPSFIEWQLCPPGLVMVMLCYIGSIAITSQIVLKSILASPLLLLVLSGSLGV